MRGLAQVCRGRTPRQAHRDLDGVAEDGLTRQGFDGPSAMLYRTHDPRKFRATGRFKTTALPTAELQPTDLADPAGLPVRLFHNEDCAIWCSRRSQPMPWFRRNVDGDECWFVHRGTGVVETEFGPLRFEPGDYVVIPKAVTHRWIVEPGEAVFFGCETKGELGVPVYPGLGRHAPFDLDVLRIPEPEPVSSNQGEHEIRVKYDDEYSSVFVDYHPCDVIGWKGDLFPFAFNIRDWNVVMSDSLHLPPSMHVFLTAPGVNIINLLPRPLETVHGVERLPFYHRNADYDEVALIHGGDMLGRPMVTGLITHEPQGIHHGLSERLHQMSHEEWDKHSRIGWQIIMVETSRPLRADAAVAEAGR